MQYECHKVNFRSGAPNIDSTDWTKKKRATISSKNKDDKSFQYAVMVALNYEEIKGNLETVLNIKPFVNKCGKEQIVHQKQMIGKRLRKLVRQLLLIFCILKNKKDVQLIIQKLIQTAKNK